MMTRDALRCLFSVALLFMACATGAPVDSDRLCVPNDFVYCRCANGGEGTKQCNVQGDGFGECQECQQTGGPVCQPGQTQLCFCRDGVTQGTQPCNVEGTGFEDVCLGCPDGTGGTGGDSGSGGDGGTGGDAGRGGSGGGEAGSSGAGGTGGSGIPGDQCPGVDVSVDKAMPTQIFGTTLGMLDDFQGADLCQDVPSNDVVYRVTPRQTGTLNIAVTPNEASFDPMVYVRRAECTGEQIGCRDGALQGSDEGLSIGVNAEEALYVVVDGALGTAGPFRLNLSLNTTALCGDGAVAAPEQCDDANKLANDFCSVNCLQSTVPNVAGAAGCANGVPKGGVPVHVFDNVAFVNGTTAVSGKNAQLINGSGCGASTAVQATAEGNDVVYQVVPHRSGKLVVTLDPAVTLFDSVLYVRGGGCTGNEIVCDDEAGDLSGEQLQVTVVRDVPVWVVIDGYGVNNKGPFRFSLSIEDP